MKIRTAVALAALLGLAAGLGSSLAGSDWIDATGWGLLVWGGLLLMYTRAPRRQ